MKRFVGVCWSAVSPCRCVWNSAACVRKQDFDAYLQTLHPFAKINRGLSQYYRAKDDWISPQITM